RFQGKPPARRRFRVERGRYHPRRAERAPVPGARLQLPAGGGGGLLPAFGRIAAATMSAASGPRIAVVHEWLLDFAGSERVLRELIDLLLPADLVSRRALP